MTKAKTPTVTKNKKAVTPPTPPEGKAPATPPTPPEETAPITKKLTKFKVIVNLHISEEVDAENFKEAYTKLSEMKLSKFINFQNTSVIG